MLCVNKYPQKYVDNCRAKARAAFVIQKAGGHGQESRPEKRMPRWMLRLKRLRRISLETWYWCWTIILFTVPGGWG